MARREDALVADGTTLASLAPRGVAAGTPYVMAPEQVRGSGTDARTDIWALGVLLHEMVSGAQPFSASTSPELFSSILRDAPAPLPSGVPTVLRLVIERCLEKEPECRYERARLGRARPVNPQAYEAYLRGLSHLEKLTREELNPALRYFEAALEADPTYALAHLRIHQVWSARQQLGTTPPREAAPAM